MKKAFLGIDTSNYRTSVCVIDESGTLLYEEKQLLSVASGERGLRQSEAFFYHVKRLPELLSRFPHQVEWLAVGASTKPRPVENSYMPVFLCGESIGRIFASLLHIPFYPTTHQEGHIAAAEYSMESPIEHDQFLAVHLSGGTSEVLQVVRNKHGYAIERIGGSLDLHAGQLIDRIGVHLGLSFPSGPELEEIAKKGKGLITVPSSVTGYQFSFSGSETALYRYMEKGEAREEIAYATLQVVANTLEKVLRKAVMDTGIKDILVVGGVAANQQIRSRLIRRLEHPAVGAKLYFTSPAYSGDNAFGVCHLTRLKYLQEMNVV